MRAFGKFLGRVIMALIVVGLALWYFGPYEEVGFDTAFDESQLDGGVQAYFDTNEARVQNIRPGNQKRVI